MAKQLQLRRGNLSWWTTNNPVLADGEMVLVSTTNDYVYDQYRIGDGLNTFSSLAIHSFPFNTTIEQFLVDAEAARDAAQLAETNAETAETNAEAAEALAEKWAANPEDVEVESGKFSAKHYSNKAETAWDNFDDTYLGAKATDPTVDNDGGVLKVGAMYFNSVSKIFKVWDGSAWITHPALESARSQSTTKAPTSKLLDDEFKNLLLNDISNEKNLTLQFVDDRFWSSTGVDTSFSGTLRTNKIPIRKDDELWIKTQWALSSLRNNYFDVDGNFLSAFTHTSGVLTKLDVPARAYYIGLSGQDGYVTPEIIFKSKVDGEDIVDNILVIQSTSEVVKEINLQFNLFNSYYNKTTGEYLFLDGFVATEKIDVSENQFLLLNGLLSIANGCSICFYDVLGNHINQVELTSYSNYYINTPPGAVKLGLSKRTTDTLTAKLVGKVIYDSLKNSSEWTASSFYEIGQKYTEIIASNAINNYGLLFAGQSNAVGQTPFSELESLSLPTSLNVNHWDVNTMNYPYTLTSPTTWGAWWSILKRLKDYKPSTDIYFSNVSSGGKSLEIDFNPTTFGQWAQYFNTWIKAMLAYSTPINLKAMVWIQGENDYLSPNRERYYTNLKRFIHFVRGVVSDPLFPIYIVGMHKNQDRFDTLVREAQKRVAIESVNVYFVSPDSLTWTHIGDNLHYNGVYNEAIGDMLFNLIKDL